LQLVYAHYILILSVFNVNAINILKPPEVKKKPMENRTARLTLLIDPEKKAAFEELCKQEDVTASQKVRQFIREYVEERLGPDWREERKTNS
jgi:hypothetical protein